jgi:hypothetical protein
MKYMFANYKLCFVGGSKKLPLLHNEKSLQGAHLSSVITKTSKSIYRYSDRYVKAFENVLQMISC